MFWSSTPTATVAAIVPPSQPVTGPGGSALPYSTVVTTARTLSPDAKSYWVLSPSGYSGPLPAPTSLPLVVFLHGFAFFNNLNTPAGYASWVNHICRQGNIVVFPKYQNSFDASSAAWTTNATASIKDAIARPWPTIPADISKGMIMVSHSAGGLVSANVANRYVANALPIPTALVLAMPYQDAGLDASLAGIPAACRILGVVADKDTNVGRTGLDAIFDRTSHVTIRNYVQMFGDNHGSPALVADHHVPEESNGQNALDWNGLWKFSDAMRDCVILGTECSFVDGGSTDETSLGLWSDGVAVRPMVVTTSKP